MNKAELMKSLWIHVTSRLPPQSDDDVLLYIPEYKTITVCKGWIAREDAMRFIGDDGKIDENVFKYFAWDRRFTHWMKIYGP